ncbi:MAG: antibiotic biosynthesis monooxygenase [Dehalococcoidia bacterium]|nr:antibiotic biosynthesis monooxygenase [Dehalococcoidia bacterium]
MITVIAKLQAQPGKEDEMKAELTRMVQAVSATEPDVPAYSLHQADDDPTVFYFYEQYANTEAQEAHRQTEHMKALGAAMRDMAAGRPEVTLMTQVAGIERE